MKFVTFYDDYLREEYSKSETKKAFDEYYLANKERKTEIEEDLILRNYKLAISVSNKIRWGNHSIIEFEDILQYAIIGLIQAIRSYDTSKNLNFSTLASICMERECVKGIITYDGIRRPTYVHTILNIIKKFSMEFYKENGKIPSQDMILDYIKKERKEGKKIKRDTLSKLILSDVYINTRSLFEEFGEGKTLLDVISNECSEHIKDSLETEKLYEKVMEAFEKLDERDQQILSMLLGFEDEKKSLRDIGKELGISGERVRQLKDKSLKRMRILLKNIREV